MEPEVIIKQQFFVDCTGDCAIAVPELLLLGNAEGLRQLGEQLIDISRQQPNPTHIDWDPDDHQHVTMNQSPFNSKLSDRLEFRVGLLSQVNRDAVLLKYGISESTQEVDDLRSRYPRQVDSANEQCACVDRVIRRANG